MRAWVATYFFLLFFCLRTPALGLTIQIDYRYDVTGFFDHPDARAAIEAAARRWSRIINQPLAAVDVGDDEDDRRFVLRHPGTGELIEVSSASGVKSDALVEAGASPADEYWGGIQIPADTFVVFVGSRDLDSLGLAGPLGGGTNFEEVFKEVDGLLNRGFNALPEFGNLTVIGGFASFDSDGEFEWHFNHLTTPEQKTVDFYSIALHELGHCFGLGATGVVEWEGLIEGDQYFGENALSAYRQDHESNLKSLPVQGMVENRFDYHWKDEAIDSIIFPLGQPNYLSTVGRGGVQEVLMSATAYFAPGVPRHEVTNIDVGALKDLGWSVLEVDPPQEPPIELQISRDGSGEFILKFSSQLGANYRIQTSLDSHQWNDVTPSILGKNEITTWLSGDPNFIDPNGLGAYKKAGFFRVVKD